MWKKSLAKTLSREVVLSKVVKKISRKDAKPQSCSQ